jgi:hypothetical protein
MCQEFRRIGYLFALSLGCALSAVGAPRLIYDGKITEHVDPAMPVNSVSAVGLALAANTSADATLSQPAKIWVYLPDEVTGTIEVRITTMDGRYVGQLEFALLSGPGGWEEIDLDTKVKQRDEILRQYTRHQLAYAVTIKQGDNGPWLPVASANPTNSESAMKSAVLLNSAGAESVFYSHPKTKTRIRCKPVTGPRPRHFNTACEIGLNELLALSSGSPSSSPQELIIMRASGTRYLDPITLTLR